MSAGTCYVCLMKKPKNKHHQKKPRQNLSKASGLQSAVEAGVASRDEGPLSIRTHTFSFVVLLLAALGVLSGLKDLVEVSPRLERLAELYLAVVEWPWRHICRLLGIRFFPEVAVQMTAFMSLIAVSFSSLWLENKHGVKPPDLDNKPAWREWRLKRQVLGFCSAVVASGLFVFATELLVLRSGIAEAIARYPLWYWSLHMFVAFVAFPSILALAGPRQVSECVAVGALCGIFVTLIWLPSAARAFIAGTTDVSHFRRAVLEFYIVRTSISLGIVMGLASPRFMLAQLIRATMAVGLVIGASWLATR